MRQFALPMLALCAVSLLFGCKGQSSPETEAKVKRAKEEIKHAVSATADAASAKRDEYAKEMNKQLAVLDVKIAELKDQASRAAGQTKKDLERRLEEAKLKH